MPVRFIETPRDLDTLVTYLRDPERKLPLAVSITPGSKRTNRQNRLARQWCNDIHEQKPEESAEYWRGYCKLHHGVPILRNQDEEFCRVYDKHVRSLTYEAKMALMMVPLDMPVTRIMSVKQHSSYLDAIYRDFAQQGIVLTDPEMFGLEAMKVAA